LKIRTLLFFTRIRRRSQQNSLTITAKELIQDNIKPEILSAELMRLLETETNKKMRGKVKRNDCKTGKRRRVEAAAEAIKRESAIWL